VVPSDHRNQWTFTKIEDEEESAPKPPKVTAPIPSPSPIPIISPLPASNGTPEVNLDTASESDLVQYLSSSSPRDQKRAADALSILTGSSGSSQDAAFKANAIPALVQLLNSDNDEAYEPAVVALRNITILPEAEVVAAEEGAIPALVRHLTSENVAILQSCCKAIKNICWTKESARAVAFSAGSIPALVDLLSHANIRVQNAAAYALRKVSLHMPASQAAHQAHAIPTLVRLLDSNDVQLQKAVSGVLYAITTGEMARPAKVTALEWNAIPALVRLLDADHTEVYESAAGALRNITFLSEAEAVAADAGAITALVKVLNTAKEAGTLRHTLESLNNICWSRDEARAMAWNAGAVERLVEFLSYETVKVKEASLLVLSTICIHGNAATAAYEAGIVPILITFLESATETGILKNALGCLRATTRGSSTRLAKVAALSGRAIPAIVDLLNGDKTEVYENGAATIRNLTLLEEAEMPASDGGVIPPLIKLLSSSEVKVIQLSCEAIKNICLSKEAPRIVAFNSGAIPALIDLLSHSNIRVQDAAASALWKIILHEPARAAAHEKDATLKVIQLLSSEDRGLLKATVGCLSALTTGPSSPSAKKTALNFDAIPNLVRLLNANHTEIYETGSTALQNIVVLKEAELVAVDSGAIQALLRILLLSEGSVVQRACGAIKNICWNQDRARTAAFCAGGVPTLVGLLSNKSDRIKDSAAAALWRVCLHEPAAAAAQRAEVVPILIGLLASDDTNLLKSVMGCLYANTRGSAAKLAKTEALNSGGIPAIMRLLDAGRKEVYENGAAVIRNITFLEEAEMPVAEAGALTSLVKVLSSTEPNVLRPACDAIKNICWNQDAARKKAFDAGAIPLITCLMNTSERSVQKSALGALFAITNGSKSHDIKLAAGDAVPVLIKILNSDHSDAFETSVAALCNIAGAEAPAVAAGAILALVKHLASRDVQVQTRACEALGKMCRSQAGAHAALSVNAISSLVSLLASTNKGLQKTAAMTLEKLSIYAPAEKALQQAVPLMKQLSSSGTDELKKLAKTFLERINN
jgi:hypothetical protein